MKTPHPTSDPAGFPAESLTPPVDDGGSAFPTLDRDAWGNITARGGMSLRDWFAGQTLAGMLAASGSMPGLKKGQEKAIPAAMSEVAYEFADAMLRARNGASHD